MIHMTPHAPKLIEPAMAHVLAWTKGCVRTGLVTALLLSLWLATPASAQERYELSAGDWQQIEAADPSSPEGKLQTIRKEMAQDNNKTAQNLASKWIETYPNHPMLVEAYLLRADARVKRHYYYKALFDYEYIIRMYPASEQFQTALEREYEIAKLYTAGMKRRLWGRRFLPAQADGEEVLIRIQERTPGSVLGEKASLSLGDYYFAEARMNDASIAYDLFLQNYPQSDHREGVLLRVIQANLATFKGPQFDSSGLLEAAQRIKQYQKEYPAAAERIGAEALLVRIDESLALKAYLTGQWFEDRGRRVSAVVLYQRVVRDHSQTAAAREALERLRNLGEIAAASPAALPQETLPATTSPAPAAASQESVN